MSETVESAATDDIRSALAAAMSEHETPAASPSSGEDSGAVREDASAEASDAAAHDRPRGPDGRFTKAVETAEEPVEEPVEAPQPEAKPEEQKEQPKALEAPANWAAADKAAFAKLPADGQEFLLRRHSAMEADYTRKTQEIAAFRRDYEPVAQLLNPHKEAMTARGFTPATLIQAWAQVEQNLVQGRGVDVVKAIVNGYNIDKARLAQELGFAPTTSHSPAMPEQPAGQQPALPPELMQRLNTAEQWIQRREYEDRQRAVMAQNNAATRVMSEIEQFASATDKAGALLHPHFHEVENDMALLATAVRASGREPSLSDLYDQAVRANPSTYAKVIEAERAAWEAQRAEADRKRQEEARAKAEKAKLAAKSVTGSPGSGQPPRKSELSLREQLLAASDEAA